MAKGPARRRNEPRREAMVTEGFVPNPMKWWHFDVPDAGPYPTQDVPLR